MDASEDARRLLERMESIDQSKYDLRRLHGALQHDIEALSAIWERVKAISSKDDVKLATLKDLLAGKLRGQKVLIFTYYKDTARYLYYQLGNAENPDAASFQKRLGNVHIRRMDSGADAKERVRMVKAFAPKANRAADIAGTDKEIDILISTDVLSEGQNLQDCGYLINYDLHWNPTRMVQRAGRIDRIGTDFDTLWIYNMFPDEGLERLLRLVESLSEKIAAIDATGFLDASILGETVHPRNFNTLKRIRDEDGSVIDEEEQFTELATGEFLMQQLRNLLDSGGKEMLESLPDGIHSGLVKSGAKGAFFYLQARPKNGDKMHFWEYVDLKNNSVVDNRHLISNLVACNRETPRVVDPEMFAHVFELQERAIEKVLQSSQQQSALEAAPRTVEAIQQTVVTLLQGYLSHPDVSRPSVIEAIRFLNQPMWRAQISDVRRAYKEFQRAGDVNRLLEEIEGLRLRFGNQTSGQSANRTRPAITRDDLRLICYDFVSAG
jgi:hypothetical protein